MSLKNPKIKDLAKKKATLEKDKSAILARVEGLEKQIEQADSTDLETVHQEVDDLQALEQERDETTQAIKIMKEERSGLTATLNALEAEGLGLNER